MRNIKMRKNFQDERATVEVDTVTGEYLIRIPECIVNDQGWFEDTVLGFKVDGDEIILQESDD